MTDPEALISRWKTEDGVRRRAAVLELLREKQPWSHVLEGFERVDDDDIKHHEDLRGINLSGELLDGVELSFVTMSFAIFDGCRLVRAHFQATRLSNASFRRAILREATMTGLIADGACFDEADLRNAYLDAGVLRGASFRNSLFARTDLSRSDLVGATGVNWTGQNVDLYAAKFHDVA
ncbi:MAG: pentapeptide repeat-containing protein [Polyangiales bacterium]